MFSLKMTLHHKTRELKLETPTLQVKQQLNHNIADIQAFCTYSHLNILSLAILYAILLEFKYGFYTKKKS